MVLLPPRHQAFRAIAALELYASLLCLVLFAPCSDNGTRAELVLQGTTDNQSNEALVNRCLPPSIRATFSSLNSRSRCPDARSRWTFGGSLGMKISMLMILPTRLWQRLLNVADPDASGRASLDHLATAGGGSSTTAQRACRKEDSQAVRWQKLED